MIVAASCDEIVVETTFSSKSIGKSDTIGEEYAIVPKARKVIENKASSSSSGVKSATTLSSQSNLQPDVENPKTYIINDGDNIKMLYYNS